MKKQIEEFGQTEFTKVVDKAFKDDMESQRVKHVRARQERRDLDAFAGEMKVQIDNIKARLGISEGPQLRRIVARIIGIGMAKMVHRLEQADRPQTTLWDGWPEDDRDSKPFVD